jgi:hypothetical protein
LYDRGQQSLEDDKTKRPTYKRMGSGSILYEAFWGGEAEHFDVPATATTHGAATMDLLNNKLQTSNGPVYLLGIVDLPEISWNPYLRARCGLPYTSFDKIRSCSEPLEKLACADGTSEVLWRMSLDCYLKNDHNFR